MSDRVGQRDAELVSEDVTVSNESEVEPDESEVE